MNGNGQKWEISTASWVRAVVVIAVAYAIFLVRELILVVITAVVIASAIEPATVWARKQGIPRLPTVLLVFVGSILIVTALFYFLLLPLIGEMSNFVRTLTIYSESVAEGGILSDLFKGQELFRGLDTPIVIRELSTYLSSLSEFISQGVFSSVSSIFGGVLNFILIVVFSFYLVTQEDGVSKFLKIITPAKHEQYIINLWHRSQTKIGLWMKGQLIASVVITILVYIGLLIAGVPNALLLAVVAGVFDLVPIVGPIVASVPAVFLGFISGGAPLAIIVVGIYLLVQQIEGNVIFPLVHKKLVGVPPTVSILALVIGGTLAGFLGVLISVPVAAAVMELISDFERRKLAQSPSAESSS